MTFEPPTEKQQTDLIGETSFGGWCALNWLIEDNYNIHGVWNSGGKKWYYEYKYRRGGKRSAHFTQDRKPLA